MKVIVAVFDGYPYRFGANNSKGEKIVLGLKKAGVDVVAMNSLFGDATITEAITQTSATDLKYITFPKKNKKWSFFGNLICFYNYLKNEKEEKGVNVIIFPMIYIPFFITLSLTAKFAGYKRATLFHEWPTGCAKGKSKLRYIEAYLREHLFGYFLDYIFPIGHLLESKARKFKKTMMLLPILGEFDAPCGGKKITPNSFTYCCSAPYLMRCSIIIDAFKDIVNKHNNSILNLVLIGTKDQLAEIAILIKEKYNLENSVRIYNQIPYSQLYDLYLSSLALFIPLDPNNLQDSARFSQKIAEYLSTSRPIITNNVGEIPYYFTNKKNAMIADYTISGFIEVMEYLIQHPDVATQIGINGFKRGKESFDSTLFGVKIKKFLNA